MRCPTCPHDLADHCKGDTHYPPSDAKKALSRGVKCKRAHCKAPLCSCLGVLHEAEQ